MNRQIEAIYSNGAFHPVKPIDLPEQQRVIVDIPDDADADDIEPVWRGVFVTNIQPEFIFTKEIDIAEGKLPKRPIHVNIDPDRVCEDDE